MLCIPFQSNRNHGPRHMFNFNRTIQLSHRALNHARICGMNAARPKSIGFKLAGMRILDIKEALFDLALWMKNKSRVSNPLAHGAMLHSPVARRHVIP